MSDGHAGERCNETARFTVFSSGRRICRLGLATRGNTSLDRESVIAALDHGIDYLNWCGHPDGMRDAIRHLGDRRNEVVVAVQLKARTAQAARRELSEVKRDLHTNYLDVVTYYYVEDVEEWRQIVSRGGAAEVLEEERSQGSIEMIGLTSHQRLLAAQFARSSRLDLLMVRYNAAHRGAEEEVFPVTRAKGIPVVAFTCLRWGALLEKTPQDPSGFAPPSAPQWYRFVLDHPDVAVALMAPDGDDQLQENLSILKDWRTLDEIDFESLAAHGQRVRAHATYFSLSGSRISHAPESVYERVEQDPGDHARQRWLNRGGSVEWD